MAVSRDVLGMNARNFLYIRKYNKASAKRIADDKLATKQVLITHDIPTPTLLAAFYNRQDIQKFSWNLPESGFVIKPGRGYGGAGILPLIKWKDPIATTAVGKELGVKQLERHLLDILDGAYSLQFIPDHAFIEERVQLHPFFRKIVPVGIPDIRIIVFHKVPIMAMMRLPTTESGGKANLHLGAFGLGIDMRTGITTYAVSKNRLVDRMPKTKLKLSGIKIPMWDELLLLASRTQEAIGLGYTGVDIVFDAKKGPLILEVNARPGLSIQLANLDSLRTRLERVEGMQVQSPKRGVEVAKSLFAEAFSERVLQGIPVVSVIQEVTIRNKDHTKTIFAKLDTGAYRSSIDIKLADLLRLPKTNEEVFVRSASGKRYRPTVQLQFDLYGKRINTVASVVDRSDLTYPMIVGRRDLKGFLINPVIENAPEETEEDFTQLFS